MVLLGEHVAEDRRADVLSGRSDLDRRRHGSRCSKVVEIDDSNGYDFLANTFGHLADRDNIRALNVNTIDEVPIRAGS
jgi:hypothetical protein